MTEKKELVCKSDLVETLVESGLLPTKKVTHEVLDLVFTKIAVACSRGKKVRISGFGTFQVKHRPARMARNPLNGAEINVPAKDVLVFKASK